MKININRKQSNTKKCGSSDLFLPVKSDFFFNFISLMYNCWGDAQTALSALSLLFSFVTTISNIVRKDDEN